MFRLDEETKIDTTCITIIRDEAFTYEVVQQSVKHVFLSQSPVAQERLQMRRLRHEEKRYYGDPGSENRPPEFGGVVAKIF